MFNQTEPSLNVERRTGLPHSAPPCEFGRDPSRRPQACFPTIAYPARAQELCGDYGLPSQPRNIKSGYERGVRPEPRNGEYNDLFLVKYVVNSGEV